MRQIVLDTETTVFDPRQGCRIIEIACIEMVNCRPATTCTSSSIPSATSTREPAQ